MHLNEGKSGCGFSGVLIQITTILKESLDSDTGYGGWLKKTQAVGDLATWLNDFLSKKKEGEEKIRVVHEVAKPFYSLSKLPDFYRDFFDETEAINARMQI